ncbi:hypothetical protein HY493_03260 [Candidatus Woesearchaeota archaeon]|nr:hypothetical protein [Candidatus Woesearchaeota archaeon]
MKKLNIIGLLMALLLSTSVSAYVDVTYQFNAQNVEIAAYDILNSDGSEVGPFSGELLDGDSTTDGEITIRFPDSLATDYGYAVYYVSPGYVPLEAIATWHSYGDSAAYYQDYGLNFYKLNDCRAVIDEFTVTNTAYPNVPIVINMETGLDATMLSAFSLTDNQLEYIPPQFIEEYYSAEIEVTLRIYNSADSLVYTETQEFNVFAGDYQAVSFTWIPGMEGQFRAVITTVVVDDQCAGSVPGQSEKSFTVADSLPQNECYTIINGLYALPEQPVIGEDVTVYFNKITNHANDVPYGDPGYDLSPIPTDYDAIVNGPAGISFQDSGVLDANANNYDPEDYSFTFTPSAAGMYTVTVSGSGASPLCNGLSNPVESATLQLFARNPDTFQVMFQLSDAITGAKVQGAVINMDGQYIATDANGIATFTDLAPDTYGYVITHPNYLTISGSTTVTDVDQVIFLALTPGDGEDVPIPAPSAGTTPEKKEEFGIGVSSIRIEDFQAPGSDVPVHITFSNDGNQDLRVKASVVIQDLGIRASASVDLDKGDEHTETIWLPLDGGIEPGIYPVRITLHSDETQRVVYRDLVVEG